MADQLNDVNLDAMMDFDQKVRENPALARRTVKVRSSWLSGTKTLVEIGEHRSGGDRATPKTRKFVVTSDTPPGLGGVDAAPAPLEVLLAAVTSCITSGIAANAARFDVPIDALEVDLEADIDFRGVLGHDKTVRNGCSDLRYSVTIQSPAPEDKVRRCKETIDRKSPVVDMLRTPVNISSSFVYKPH